MGENHVDTWEHFNPVHVIAGLGSRHQLARHLENSRHVLIVTSESGTRRGMTNLVAENARGSKVSIFDSVTPNPELHDLAACAAKYRSAGIDTIVAIDGGSAIDTGKVLSVVLPISSDSEWIEALRSGRPQHWQRRIPVIALPTTAGTGAEVTPFATVWDKELKRKYSVAGSLVFPTTAIVDPELTLSLPPTETLYTGLDAISHALESLWNKHRTPISTQVSLGALKLAVEALPRVLANPGDLQGRAKMHMASTLAGMAISQTRTAIAHSLSYPLTVHFNVPHGLACSFTLPEILRQNFDTLVANIGDRETLTGVRNLLAELNISHEIEKFVSADRLKIVEQESLNLDRLGNFNGSLDCEPFELVLRSMIK